MTANAFSVETIRSDTRFDLISGDVSPDGRYFSQVNWASGDLQLLDLSTGETRDLTGGGYAGGYAWTSAFSPDGMRIAYAWYLDAAGSHELRLFDLKGDSSRTLLPADPARFYVDPVSWSTSGREILVAMQVADRTWQLALIDALDGTIRVVKALNWQAPGGGHDQSYPDAELSPDGRYVAYDYPALSAATRDIYVVPTDGGPARALVAGPASDRLLGWLPNGGGILFYSDRDGSPKVWRLGVRDGRPTGVPEPVIGGVEALVPLGFTRDGYVFGVIREAERVRLAPLGPDAPGSSVASKPVHEPPWRKSLAFDFSPDGTRLAYTVMDPLPNPVESLVIATLDGAVVRSVPLTPRLHASNGTLRWVSANTLYLYAYERGTDGIYEISLDNGRLRRVGVPPSLGRGSIKWFDAALNDRTLYMIAGGDIVAAHTGTSDLRRIPAAGAIGASLAVSPDGTQLAYLARDAASRRSELRVVAANGAEAPRVVYRAPAGQMRPPVTWSPDGSRIVFALEAGGARDLWVVGARGSSPALFLRGCCQENHVRIHLDGRLAAFSGGVDRAEVRVLKGLERR